MSIEMEFDYLFWQAALAWQARDTVDDVIRALQVERQALQAEVERREHVFAGFCMAHPEFKEISDRRAAEHAERMKEEAAG